MLVSWMALGLDFCCTFQQPHEVSAAASSYTSKVAREPRLPTSRNYIQYNDARKSANSHMSRSGTPHPFVAAIEGQVNGAGATDQKLLLLFYPVVVLYQAGQEKHVISRNFVPRTLTCLTVFSPHLRRSAQETSRYASTS